MSLEKLTNFGGIGVNAEERSEVQKSESSIALTAETFDWFNTGLSKFAPSSPSKLQVYRFDLFHSIVLSQARPHSEFHCANTYFPFVSDRSSPIARQKPHLLFQSRCL